MRLRELSGERAYEAELAECAGVTGYHRWFFLTAFAAALGLRLRAFAVDSDAGPLGGDALLVALEDYDLIRRIPELHQD